MNQEDKKINCPLCGGEIDKNINKCENCSNVIEVEDLKSDEVKSISNNSEESSVEETIDENVTKSVDEKSYKVDDAAHESNNTDENESLQKNTYNKNTKTDYSYAPYRPQNARNNNMPPKPLTNAIKVALTATCVMVPFVGQFVGLVLSIIFMNSDEEFKDFEDRRSFGLALLIASVIAFIVTCIGSFINLVLLARKI